MKRTPMMRNQPPPSENTIPKNLKYFSVGVFLILALLVFIDSVLAATLPTPDPQSMILYYRFNNDTSVGENYAGTGSVVYDYAQRYNASFVNNTFFPTGGILQNGSVHFDGLNTQYVNVNSGKWNGSFSFSVWLNLSYRNTANAGYVLQSRDSGNKWYFSLGINYYRFGVYNDSGTAFLASLESIEPNNDRNNLVHWVGTFNGTELKLYKNGLEVDTTTFNGPITNMDLDKIGILTTNNLNGSVDEVIIYNNSLSPDFVHSLYADYVRTTTSISSCGTYSQNYTIYNLTTNLTSTGNCIIINGNYNVLEGNNFTINFANGSSTGRGVQISSGRYNNTIQNLRVLTENGNTTTKYGILDQGINNTYINNYLNLTGSNDGYCIFISNSNGSRAINNTCYTYGSDDGWGIFASGSYNGFIDNNYIETHGQTSEAVVFLNSKYFTLTNNNFNNTRSKQIRIDGNTVTDYNHTIDTTNTANGYPINYTFNIQNQIIQNADFTSTGQFIIGYANNLTLRNVSFGHSGVYFSSVTNSTIYNFSILGSSGAFGIGWKSTDNVITNGTINGTAPCFFMISDGSNRNNISHLQIYNYGTEIAYPLMKYMGIFLYGSNHTTILNNQIETSANGSPAINSGAGSSYTNVSNNILRTFGVSANPLFFIDYTTGLYIANNTLTCDAFCGKLIFLRTNYGAVITADNQYNNSQNVDLNINTQDATLLLKHGTFNLNFSSNHTGNIYFNTDYMRFTTTGSASTNITLQNINNAYINYSNSTIVCTNISICTGTLNLTIPTNFSLTILDRFNVTDQSSRTYSPIQISGTGNDRSLFSSVAQTLTDLQVNILTTAVPSSPRQLYPNGTYETLTYSYAGNVFSAQEVEIPPGVSVIELRPGFPPNAPTDAVCQTGMNSVERGLLFAGVIGAFVFGVVMLMMGGITPASMLLLSIAILLMGVALNAVCW